MQEVMRQSADVVLEDFDALLGADLLDLVGMERRQFPAGLVERVELLLLLHLGGDVSAEHNELVHLARFVYEGRHTQVEVTIAGKSQAGGGSYAGERGAERSRIGTAKRRRAKGF